MADDIELFNAHQEDVRRRADSLVRALLILSGGALTLSIGVLTGPSAPKIEEALATVLKISWLAFFFAIAFLTTTLIVIIARDYANGERWRRGDGSDNPRWIEVVIWVVALLGFLCFLGGMFPQAYVATNLI